MELIEPTTTEISVSSLEKGVYIANVGGEMIKFIK